MAYASRRASYLTASCSAFLQVAASWWNIFSHTMFESASPWNIVSLSTYAGVAITLVGIWFGLRRRAAQPYATVSPIRFVNVAGLKLAGIGCLIVTTATAWNMVVGYVNPSGFANVLAEVFLVLGILTVNLGIAIGLTIEYGMIRQSIVIASTLRRTAVALCIIVTFSGIWLAGSGGLIRLGTEFRPPPLNWLIAFFLALFGTFVLVPLKRVMSRVGSGVGMGVVFNTVAYLFLLAYAESRLYVPWGILLILLFELIFSALIFKVGFKRASLLSSVVTGVFFGATYYPFTAFVFPWSFSLQPAILGPVVGSVVGALLGGSVYTGLTSVALGGVTVP